MRKPACFYLRGIVGILLPHQLSQPLLFLLAPEDGIDGTFCEFGNLSLAQPEMLRNKRILIREATSKDANIIGLLPSACFHLISGIEQGWTYT